MSWVSNSVVWRSSYKTFVDFGEPPLHSGVGKGSVGIMIHYIVQGLGNCQVLLRLLLSGPRVIDKGANQRICFERILLGCKHSCLRAKSQIGTKLTYLDIDET